jgi:hypothetical protein
MVQLQREIQWSHDTTRNVLVARLYDTTGQAWTAIVEHNPPGHHARVVAILSCRSAGRYISTQTCASVEEAQQWCYEAIGIT